MSQKSRKSRPRPSRPAARPVAESPRSRPTLRDVDVLIHDAQFLDHERPRAVDYGHATIDEAIGLAELVNARSLVLFHHGPHRTDVALDQIGREFGRGGFVRVAAEGMVIDLG